MVRAVCHGLAWITMCHFAVIMTSNRRTRVMERMERPYSMARSPTPKKMQSGSVKVSRPNIGCWFAHRSFSDVPFLLEVASSRSPGNTRTQTNYGVFVLTFFLAVLPTKGFPRPRLRIPVIFSQGRILDLSDGSPKIF